MGDDKIKIDEEVVEQLTGVADSMAKMLGQVMESHDYQSKDMDYFRADLAIVRDMIRRLAVVLHEGNGEKPLITRVAILETQIRHVLEDVSQLEMQLLEQDRLEDEKRNIDKKGKWALRVAVVSGVVALAVAIFNFLGG